MTWLQLMETLGGEFQKLRPSKASARESYLGRAAALARTERQTAERIDALVRHFAAHSQWPDLTNLERFFLRERIRFAYEYAGIASVCLDAPTRMLRRDTGAQNVRLLEWLLIDVWRRSGVRNWVAPLVELSALRRGTKPPKDSSTFGA